jgi:hypothetical protein
MSTIGNYIKIKDTYPEMGGCFYAFSNAQFAEGMKQMGIAAGTKIYSGGAGLYGTREGLDKYFKELDEILARIPKECAPQDVYNYEFGNHECGWTQNDTDAIKLVAAYFGEEIAKTIERRCACVSIDNLFKPV